MKNAITLGISMLFVTFVSVILVNFLVFESQKSKLEDYHYAVVNEIESSDFSPSVINEIKANGTYKVTITNVSSKEDLAIYQVTTEKELTMPIFKFKVNYVKESTAR